MPALITDPHAIASLAAAERALAWYVDEAARANQPPISAADAIALQAVIAGNAPLRPELFDPLMTFARTMTKIGGAAGAPRCNLGDLLAAIEVAQPTGATEWRFDPTVDAETLTKLGFRQTSQNIDADQRANRESWWAHAKRSRVFIEAAARVPDDKSLAIVLGAGAGYDLPLLELARVYDRVVLIDVDGDALGATIGSVFKDPGLRAKVTPRVCDLTGVGSAMVRAFDDALATATDGATAVDAVLRVCWDYRRPDELRVADAGERAGLIVSGCVLSQLAWPWQTYAERLVRERGGTFTTLLQRRWDAAFAALRLRVQQHHIQALAAAADTVAVTSDAIGRTTRLDPAGAERDAAVTLLLGSESLADRIPCALAIDDRQAWSWHMRRARRAEGGWRVDVEAVHARRASA